jgi:Domain of unknown function (DUF4328)
MDGRRRAVVLVFVVLIVIDLVAVGSSLLELRLVDRVNAGEVVGDAELESNDNRQAAMGVMQTLAMIAAAIVFIRWLRLAYRNVDVLAPGFRRFRHGWAIGAWFVPFLNLWRPKQIVNDVSRATAPSPSQDTGPPLLVNVWWAGWLVTSVVAQIAVRLALEQDTLEQLRTSDLWYIASDSLDAIVAVLAVLVVHRLSADLDAKAAASPAPAGPLPYPSTSVGPPTSAPAPAPGDWGPGAPERPQPPG